MKKIYAKTLTVLEPGKLVWRTIRIFSDFHTADDWLWITSEKTITTCGTSRSA